MNSCAPTVETTRASPLLAALPAGEEPDTQQTHDAYSQLQRYAHDLQETLREREYAYRQLHAYVQDLQSAIKQRNIALAEAKAAAAAKSRLISNVSHEFRTPLTTILGFTEILAAEEKKASRHDLFNRVLGGGRRIEALVGNLLTLARLDTGSLPIRPEPCDVAALLQDETARFAERARAKGLCFDLKLPACPIEPIMLDEARLRQALVALLDNALKFTQQGGITVQLHADGVSALPSRIEIVDTGIGIAAADHERIMESFEQADGSSTRAFDGAGLGLTVAKCLLDLVGCRLLLASASGAGSTFSIVLPSAQTADLLSK